MLYFSCRDIAGSLNSLSLSPMCGPMFTQFMQMHRLKPSIFHLPQWLSTLLLERESLTETGAHWFSSTRWPASFRYPRVSPHLLLLLCLASYVDPVYTMYTDSGSHAYMTNVSKWAMSSLSPWRTIYELSNLSLFGMTFIGIIRKDWTSNARSKILHFSKLLES